MGTNIRPILATAVAMIVCGVTSARADHLSAQDQKFMQDTARNGMHEVHMAHMGMEKAQSEAVKGFARQLATDHSNANKELMDLAKKKGVTLPADDPKSAMSSPVAQKTGTEFDKTFVQTMIEAHQKGIASFEKQASEGSDLELKSWVNKMLPTLRSHLSKAQSLSK